MMQIPTGRSIKSLTDRHKMSAYERNNPILFKRDQTKGEGCSGTSILNNIFFFLLIGFNSSFYRTWAYPGYREQPKLCSKGTTQ